MVTVPLRPYTRLVKRISLLPSKQTLRVQILRRVPAFVVEQIRLRAANSAAWVQFPARAPKTWALCTKTLGGWIGP